MQIDVLYIILDVYFLHYYGITNCTLIVFVLVLKCMIILPLRNLQTLALIHLKTFVPASLLTTTDGEATTMLEDLGKGNHIIHLLTTYH